MQRPLRALVDAGTRTVRVVALPFEVRRYARLSFLVLLCWLGAFGGITVGATLSADTVRTDAFGTEIALRLGSPEPWMPVAAAVAALLAGVAAWTLSLFLSSRATFHLIHAVATSRSAVERPWRAWAADADALFRLRLALSLLAALFLAVVAPGVGTDLSVELDLSTTPWAWTFELGGVPIGFALVAYAAALCHAAVQGLLIDLVAPLVYARHLTVCQACRALWRLALASPRGFAGYLLLRAIVGAALYGLVIGVSWFNPDNLVGLDALVRAVALAPAVVFVRAFSLEFLGQLSGDLGDAFRLPAEEVRGPPVSGR